jgi:predicted dehydrogenase
MTTSPVRVGLIGAGMIAQVMHLPHLLELTNLFTVTALCDLSRGTAQAVADKYGVPQVYTDHRVMLERADLDAVLVLTRDHAQPAIDAARAGKHLFVEKPMCNNLSEADELIDAVKGSGVVGMVGYHKRYDPGYIAGREAIQQLENPQLIRLHDVIGPNSGFLAHYDLLRIDDVEADVVQQLERAHRASLEVAIGSQPEAVIRAYQLFLGLSTHDMTILHGALGLPERVISTEIWAGGRAIAAIMAYPGDLRCVFETAILTGLRKFDESMTVYSPNKVVSIVFPSPFLKNAPTLVEEWEMVKDGYRESHTTASYEEAFKLELVHFHHCIIEGRQPHTPLSEGREDLATLIAMIQAYRS